MTHLLRVFLCHASQDKPAVRELYKLLKTEEWIDPWLDEDKLMFGQNWTTVIEEALYDADIVLIFLSNNSVQKEGFVQRELNYAWELSLEKPRQAIFLIPFRLDDCEIPRHLSSKQWGDYFGEKKEKAYQTLLRSLRQRYTQKLQMESTEANKQEKQKLEAVGKDVIEKIHKKQETIKKDTQENINKVIYKTPEKGLQKQEKQSLIQKPIKKNRSLLYVGGLGISGIVVTIIFLCIMFVGIYFYDNFLVSPTATPTKIPTNAPRILEFSFPLPTDAFNVHGSSNQGTVTYETNLNSDNLISYYQYEFGKLGYIEETSYASNFSGIFTMAFTGHESGRLILIAGAPVGDGSTSVTIAFQ